MRRPRLSCSSAPPGFTLIELLVAIGVVALLVAFLLPAVQQARGAARNAQCTSHLRQIGIAAHGYVELHGQLPFIHHGAGFLFSLLPFLEQRYEYDRLHDLLVGPSATVSQALQTAAVLPVLRCPAEPLPTQPGIANYLVNGGLPEVVGQQRAFYFSLAEHPAAWNDVSDGLSQTVLCSEKRNAPPPPVSPALPSPAYGLWHVTSAVLGAASSADVEQFSASCRIASTSDPPLMHAGAGTYISPTNYYNHVVTPNGPDCRSEGLLFARSSSSYHGGGVNVLMADGAVKFAASAIDGSVWRAVGSKSGGESEAASF